MIIFKFICQGICISIFILASAFVLMFGKKKTGIFPDYLLTCLILLIIMWRIG